MHRLKRIALFGLLAYAVLVIFTVAFQRSFMYHPDTTKPPLSVEGMQEITLYSADNIALNTWYKPAPDGGKTVIFFHGNGGNLSHRRFKARSFIDAGYGMLVFDYRGYGGNAGTPTKDGLLADARAALAYADTQAILPADRIYWGESIGTGIAAAMAEKQPPAALILETPYTNIAQVAAEYYYRYVPFAEHLVWDNYSTVAHLDAIAGTPILVLHGKQDIIIPFRYGKAVFDAASEPKQFWQHEEGNHNDLHLYGAREAAIAFMDGLNEK